MTGAEHYARAEKLIHPDNLGREDVPDEEIPTILATAQVHATLALAAASNPMYGQSLLRDLADTGSFSC